MRLLITLLVFAALLGAAQARESNFIARGQKEYAAEHFHEAAEQYENAVRAGDFSAPLFYNLGNARYRADEFGRAILSYERALALEPAHPEAIANLQVARDKARALQLPATWWEQYLRWLQPNHYAVASAVAFWVALFALAALWFSRRRSVLVRTVLVSGILVAIGSSAALYRLETGSKGRGRAIVIGEKIDARLATADSSGTVLTLPAGSEIEILSTRGEWTYAALPNGLRGWIPANSAERVRL